MLLPRITSAAGTPDRALVGGHDVGDGLAGREQVVGAGGAAQLLGESNSRFALFALLPPFAFLLT